MMSYYLRFCHYIQQVPTCNIIPDCEVSLQLKIEQG